MPSKAFISCQWRHRIDGYQKVYAVARSIRLIGPLSAISIYEIRNRLFQDPTTPVPCLASKILGFKNSWLQKPGSPVSIVLAGGRTQPTASTRGRQSPLLPLRTMDATKCITQAFAGEGIQEGCMGAILSKVLGYAVVAGSAALKLPQVSPPAPVLLVCTQADEVEKAILNGAYATLNCHWIFRGYLLVDLHTRKLGQTCWCRQFTL